MSSLKISQITTCRAHVQFAPWLLKFGSYPDESDIFETALQSGLKAPSTRLHGAFVFAKKLYCADINIDISFTTHDSRITTVKIAIYTAVMRKDGKTLCSETNGFYKEVHYECCAFSCSLSLRVVVHINNEV